MDLLAGIAGRLIQLVFRGWIPIVRQYYSLFLRPSSRVVSVCSRDANPPQMEKHRRKCSPLNGTFDLA